MTYGLIVIMKNREALLRLTICTQFRGLKNIDVRELPLFRCGLGSRDSEVRDPAGTG